MKDVYDELRAVIDFLQCKYSEVTNEWLQSSVRQMNMKKVLVAEIDVGGPVYQSIMEYVQLLNERSVDIELQLSSVCNCAVTSRVKAKNSIEYKIYNYKTARHVYGKIPMNKCINDLFGARIILDTYLTFEELRAFVFREYSNSYKCIDSSKLDYKATHLYFSAGNKSFPWELQVWNQCDVRGNLASHKRYKQDYTTWEKESREGGILHG